MTICPGTFAGKMIIMKNVLVAFSFLLLLTSCSEQRTHTVNKDEIFRQTKAVNDASLMGHVQKDAARITAAYAQDAIVFPPGGAEPVIGKAAIDSYYVRGVAGADSVLGVSTSNIYFDVTDENNAVEAGRYTMSYKPAGADKAVEIKGTMLIVWIKIGGLWKIQLDMWH